MFFIDTAFTYDDISSDSMGVVVCSGDSETGLITTPFGVKQKDVSEQVRSKFYHNRTDLEQFSFDLNFTLEDMENYRFDEDCRRKINNWLVQKDYKKMTSPDFNVVFYCKAEGEVTLKHNYLGQGILSVHFICDSYSGYAETGIEYHDELIDNPPEGTIITVNNISNISLCEYYQPELEFQLQGTDTSISFENLTDGGRTMTFTGLTPLETIDIDCDSKEIISSLNLYRLDNCNRVWLRLWQGENRIKVIGKCTLSIRCQFPLAV